MSREPVVEFRSRFKCFAVPFQYVVALIDTGVVERRISLGICQHVGIFFGKAKAARGADPCLPWTRFSQHQSSRCDNTFVVHRLFSIDMVLKKLRGKLRIPDGLTQRLLKIWQRVRLVDIRVLTPHGSHSIIEGFSWKLLANEQVETERHGRTDGEYGK